MRLWAVCVAAAWSQLGVGVIVIDEYAEEPWYAIDDAIECRSDPCIEQPRMKESDLHKCLDDIASPTCHVDLMVRGQYTSTETILKSPFIVDLSELFNVGGRLTDYPFKLEGIVVRNFDEINHCGSTEVHKVTRQTDKESVAEQDRRLKETVRGGKDQQNLTKTHTNQNSYKVEDYIIPLRQVDFSLTKNGPPIVIKRSVGMAEESFPLDAVAFVATRESDKCEYILDGPLIVKAIGTIKAFPNSMDKPANAEA